jgi:hypothetical protein
MAEAQQRQRLLLPRRQIRRRLGHLLVDDPHRVLMHKVRDQEEILGAFARVIGLPSRVVALSLTTKRANSLCGPQIGTDHP